MFTASVNFVTGNSGAVMDTPGNYNLTAEFEGTSALEGDTSANFAVTIDKEAAAVVLTLPGGATMSAGGTAVAHVVITASNNGFLGDTTVDLVDGSAVLMTQPLSNAANGVFDFALRSLPVGTYSLTARYNGNSYYLANTSAPPVSLTIDKSAANITLTGLGYPANGGDFAPTGQSSVGDVFVITGNVNAGVSNPASAGGTITLNATIGGVTTALGSRLLTAGDDGSYVFTFDTSSGVLLTTEQISLSLDYSGNSVLNSGSTATPTTLTLVKANSTVQEPTPRAP